jgi:hypothetical protein
MMSKEYEKFLESKRHSIGNFGFKELQFKQGLISFDDETTN